MRFHSAFCLTLSLVGCFAPNLVEACTGISLRTTDGTAICARTMEFAADLQSNVLIIPRGKPYVGTLTQGREGLHWTSKYGAAGANAMGLELIIDGVNERGLACGIFYHPGYASFPAVTDENASRSMASWEFVTWALTTCASVAEVIEGLDSIELCEVVQPAMGIIPPMHFVVRDSSGACQVIEYIRGQRRVYDNPLGVITNAPTFDWHMTNLRNHVELSRLNSAPIELAGIKLQPLSNGSGLVGLPGDFTSPSRFVRAVVFSQLAEPVATPDEGINLAAHILNSFDIVIGTVKGRGTDGALERTQWTSFSDMTNRAYYFRTYANQQIRKVDLNKLDFNASACRAIPMDAQDRYEDVTGQAR